jgi:hypothetical protein
MVMAAGPGRAHHPINDGNGNDNQNAPNPTAWEPTEAPNSEQREQNGSDAP